MELFQLFGLRKKPASRFNWTSQPQDVSSILPDSLPAEAMEVPHSSTVDLATTIENRFSQTLS
jgi:hypothetical protein